VRESEAAHLLEAIAVIVYEPDTAQLVPDVPPIRSGLRWEEFISTLATSYSARFEEPESEEPESEEADDEEPGGEV
jgi:hypothetical protein